ncbi:PREDICTED: acid-sensing ion channel 1-like [Amphimedon queenslandica]|uniref:Uncharacterized protein n=1 Tax=Amphimedon queenslandica TaxID=400682 RepID=A0A1X7UE32_AMPQE|nr:PREDICTED: acid-sensing ion channel 1-like [Amphimedon queenslandica]|eukprot:XP_011405340.1 PREDICTED: acid-sensing ion channel 1-like [Amphimedon queenslandica]
MKNAGRFSWSDKYFSDFVETTTINGVIHVFRGRSKIRQIMWGLLLISSFIAVCVVIGFNIKEYVNKPTASTILVSPSVKNGLPFPAVTICNLNVYTPTGEDKEPDFSSVIHSLFNSQDLVNQTSLFDECSEVINSSDTSDAFDCEVWDLLLPDDKRFIYQCSFSHDADSEIVSCRDMFYPVLTPAGICYTFNGIRSKMPVPMAKDIGVRHGLNLILNIEQDSHPTFHGLTGVKVIVHDRNDISRPNLYGISVAPGQNVAISVERKVYIDKTKERDCTNDERELGFFPSTVYSQFACKENALYQHLADESVCGCVPNPYRPSTGPYINTPNCTLHSLCCLLQEYFDYRVSSATCPLPCQFSMYDYKSSYSSFPNGHALKSIAKSLNLSQDAVKNNFLSVQVYLESLETHEYVTKYSKTLTGLFGDIGGLIGLFLGMSIISIIEVLVLILDELKKLLCIKKFRKKVKKVDDMLTHFLPDVK